MAKPGRPPMISLAEHPRAAASIRRLKAWGGLAGFGVAALASLLGGAALLDAAVRGLAAGVACYFLAWAGALVIWRVLLQAEANAAVERALARREAEAERQARAAASGSGAP